MKLTDAAIRKAKPKAKPHKMADGGGLFVVVQPSGSKWWRLKYRFGGREKLLSLGVYPDVSLTDARSRREDARKLLANDVDPGEHRKATKAAKADRASNSFQVIAREWFANKSPTWATGHADKIIRRLERDIFPWIGGKPIADITAPELLAVFRRIETRGAIETAHRAKENCSQVFRYAVATGRADRDPCPDLKGALKSVRGEHFASITDPLKIGELLRDIDSYSGHFITKCALRLSTMLLTRPGELRLAEWAHFNLDAAEWRYLVTKTKTDHLVPLPTQAVSILSELHQLTGQGRFVFPGIHDKDRALSDGTILQALRRMGYDKDTMSVHGFRAMARTIMDEVLQVRPDLIEHQLAHAVKDPNGRAYNRTAHLPERRKMMQQWADYLEKLKAGAEVLTLRA